MLILFCIFSLNLNCELKFVNKEVKLMKSILNRETKKALEIINSNKDINLNEEIKGLSPFKAAILNMDKELLEALIQKGIDINSYDESGELSFITLLDIIKKNLNEIELNKVLEIFKLLLDKGIKLGLKFKDGKTILHYLVKYKKRQILEFLIKNKVNMNIGDNKNKSLLHIAVQINDLEIIKILIPNVDINVQDEKGISVLHKAIFADNIEAVKLLIDNNADINLKDLIQCSALHYAAGLGRLPIVKLLIENKADINSLDKNNTTPLHHACLFFKFKTAELLINNGADINIKDNHGRTPFVLLEFRKGNILKIFLGK